MLNETQWNAQPDVIEGKDANGNNYFDYVEMMEYEAERMADEFDY